MQTAIDELTAKEVHEYPRRTEEYERAQNQAVVNDGVRDVDLVEVSKLVGHRPNEREYQKGKKRQERNQINQQRTTAEKIFLDFQTKDRADLSQPQRPL